MNDLHENCSVEDVLVFRLQDVAKIDRKSLKLNHLLQPYHKSEANSGTVLVFLSIHTIIRKVFRRFSEICEKFTYGIRLHKIFQPPCEYGRLAQCGKLYVLHYH